MKGEENDLLSRFAPALYGHLHALDTRFRSSQIRNDQMPILRGTELATCVSAFFFYICELVLIFWFFKEVSWWVDFQHNLATLSPEMQPRGVSD